MTRKFGLKNFATSTISRAENQPGARNSQPQGGREMDSDSLLVDKTRSIGVYALSLLLLTLQFEIELLLALHCRK
jgi:hypothetical protein